MKHIYESFTKFKEFVFYVANRFKELADQFSVNKIFSLFKEECRSVKEKLSDLKKTNWDLAQYHFIAGNFNDGIMRFKMLQRSNYKVMEANYFLGRIYMEKENYLKASEYLNLYLASVEQEYKQEAEYCLHVMSNKVVSSIPKSIIVQKRDRLALNLETAKIDQTLLFMYHAIITALKSVIDPSTKVLEVGCYVGVFGRIFRETFSIQYMCGTEIGSKAAAVAKQMNIENVPVYDAVRVYNDISEIASDDNIYGAIIIPDIIRYCGDLMPLLIKMFASLYSKGIAVFVCRIVKDKMDFRFSHSYVENKNGIMSVVELDAVDTQEVIDDAMQPTFIGPIEEFGYSPYYIESLVKSCGFAVKMTIPVGSDFGLFLLQKP